MKKFRLQKFFGLLGVIIFIAGACLIYFWETVGREKYLFKEVVVASKDINVGDVIDKKNVDSMLTTIKVEDSKIISEPVTKKEDLLNFEARQFIPKNAQLNAHYFDRADIVLDKDQFVFKVPFEWIKAVPSSIRRKDIAVFYEVDARADLSNYNEQNKRLSQRETVSTIQDTQPQETPTDTHNVANDIANKEFLETYDIENFKTTIDGTLKSPVVIASVAYVKDNANREIVTVGKNERYDGSSQIAGVEIVATLKEVKALEDSVKKGNKFLVMYKEHK